MKPENPVPKYPMPTPMAIARKIQRVRYPVEKTQFLTLSGIVIVGAHGKD